MPTKRSNRSNLDSRYNYQVSDNKINENATGVTSMDNVSSQVLNIDPNFSKHYMELNNAKGVVHSMLKNHKLT